MNMRNGSTLTTIFFAVALSSCGGGGSSDSSVTVPVDPAPPVNQAPIASNSSIFADEGTTVASQLSANDPDGDALTYAVVTTPSNGVLQVDTQTGSFDYSANTGSSGTDSFTFLVSDGQADSAEATVSITINRAPVVSDDSVVVVEGDTTSSTLAGSDPDGDTITFSIVQPPATGTLDLDSQTGDFDFVADLDSEGTESFTFRASDGRLNSDDGTISITIEPRLPIEVAKLVDPNPGENDRFGWSVDISNDTAIVGSLTSDDQQYLGAAYIYSRDVQNQWNFDAQPIPANITPEETQYGYSVRISGTTALVASLTNASFYTGYVYVFDRNGANEWTQQAKLAPSDFIFGDGFGGADIAISNDTIVVGAHGSNSAERLGAVHVFDRNQAGVWSETAKIKSPDPEEWDGFGYIVAIDGDTMAVQGNQGAGISGQATVGRVFLFNRDETGSWSPSQELVDPSTNPDVVFGVALSIENDTLLVGASRGEFCDDTRYGCGAVYVFERDDLGIWSHQSSMLSPGEFRDTPFGASVALEGDKAVVGFSRTSGDQPNSVHVYLRNSTGSWIRQIEMTSSDAQLGDQFGARLSLSSNLAIFGVPNHDGLFPDSGAAYIFDLR